MASLHIKKFGPVMQSVMPMDVMTNYITGCVGENASLSMHERKEISKSENDYTSRRLVYHLHNFL